jgi:S-adenosylmethionine synthetase
MKILLTGASGLLGRALMPHLLPLAGESGVLIGTARSRIAPGLQTLDLTDNPALRRAFAAWAPDLIVHAAAERRPDVVDRDPEASARLNVGATDLLARLAAARSARFIYISTDYVFDGSSPPYATDARPSPLNAYGRMKRAGEEAVQSAYAASGVQDYAILRIPILYGRVEHLAESPVTELAVRLMDGQPLKVEDWATRYPAHADDVARAVAIIAGSICHSEPPSLGGIFHFAGQESMSKYGMALVISHELGLPSGCVQPDPNPPPGAPRPKDCQLDPTRLQSLGFLPRIAFADGIRQVLAQFRKPGKILLG